MIRKMSKNMFAAYADHVRNKRDQYELSHLDDRTLKDIGIHRSELIALVSRRVHERGRR